MNKTLKEIADDAERRWTQKGYTEAQKQARRKCRKFVITPSGDPKAFVNKEEGMQRRIEMDHRRDELNSQRTLREVWDE